MENDCTENKAAGNTFHMKKSGLTKILIIDTIMNNSQETIYFKDRNSNFILSSKAHASLFGIDDPAEVIGKSDYDYFPVVWEYLLAVKYKMQMNYLANLMKSFITLKRQAKIRLLKKIGHSI